MASLLKAGALVTSKPKSSLMLFIVKRSPLDRRHLVRHASRGRRGVAVRRGSITRQTDAQRRHQSSSSSSMLMTRGRERRERENRGEGEREREIHRERERERDSLWNLSQSFASRGKHKTQMALRHLVYTHPELSCPPYPPSLLPNICCC